MLDRIIRASLTQRLTVLLVASVLLVLGINELLRRPVDIFPDLNRPTVTVLADAHGLAPEEVETLVTIPLEAALGGTPGVVGMRSSSADGLAMVRVDFGWETDLYLDRQMVQERLQLASSDLPEGVVPEMAPISSITGEVLDLALVSPDGSHDNLELHTLADWVVRRRLMSVPGVAQVVIIGGERRQFQVLADPDLLLRHGVSLDQVAQAMSEASENTSGGYLVQGNRELQVRNLGRLRTVEEIGATVVTGERNRPVRVQDVASVVVGPEYPRGNASVEGHDAVVLIVFKQPGANTLELTQRVDAEVEAISASLPEGVVLRSDLYRQSTFLSGGVHNVVEALVLGVVLVVLVLLAFLRDWRASVITLTALPLSFAAAGLVFWAMDLGLNTMTLGGLAIAVGELVDDAIVGVENVVRRLRELDERPLLERVAEASSEVRGPIFTGTTIVVVVFLPLYALTSIEGRLFSPLATAYIASLLASMVVSLTVTPALALLLLKGRVEKPRPPARLLLWVQRLASRLVLTGISWRRTVIAGFTTLALMASCAAGFVGTEFLPPFDEGTVLVMTFAPPGTSLAESARMAGELEKRLTAVQGVTSVTRYTGRGEHDEHAPPVGISHILLTIDQDAGIQRDEILAQVRAQVAEVPGLSASVGQPLAHRIDHILSGVQAQIAIKVSGPDLDVLRVAARAVEERARAVEGVTDLYVEPQVLVPQIHVAPERTRLAQVGLTPGALAHELELALGGETVGHVLEGERSFDLFVRLDPRWRDSVSTLRMLPVSLPGGSWARLGDLARVEESAGPNAISRDDSSRRIAVSCNVEGRSLGSVVRDLRRSLDELQADLPEGHVIRLEGQFQSQSRATRLILVLSLLSMGVILVLLYRQFRSANLAFQVLICVPPAWVGGLALLLLTGQPFSVPALVGFVSLTGIAGRNGILLMEHTLALMKEAELTPELVARAGMERAAPVIMTALTTGVGLLPLLVAGGSTGREILYPVATVVIGGLLTSSFFEFLLRPAVFWTLGRGAAQRVVRSN